MTFALMYYTCSGATAARPVYTCVCVYVGVGVRGWVGGCSVLVKGGRAAYPVCLGGPFAVARRHTEVLPSGAWCGTVARARVRACMHACFHACTDVPNLGAEPVRSDRFGWRTPATA